MKGMAAQVQQLQEEMAGMKSIVKAMNTPLWWGRKPEEVLATLETEKVGAEEHDAVAAAGIILEKKERFTDEERKMVSFHIAAQMYQDRQAALKRGPVVKNCKSCGRTGHCRKSHDACPLNPRRIARKLAQQRYCIARQAAAQTVQAWWRRRHAQAQVQKVQAQTVAAEKIQAWWRRRHARVQTQNAQAQKAQAQASTLTRVAAAERIRAWGRGQLARELIRITWSTLGQEWMSGWCEEDGIWTGRHGWRELDGKWWAAEEIHKTLQWHKLNDGPLTSFAHWQCLDACQEKY